MNVGDRVKMLGYGDVHGSILEVKDSQVLFMPDKHGAIGSWWTNSSALEPEDRVHLHLSEYENLRPDQKYDRMEAADWRLDDTLDTLEYLSLAAKYDQVADCMDDANMATVLLRLAAKLFRELEAREVARAEWEAGEDL